MKPVLAIDAKATKHILYTQGIGRTKMWHIFGFKTKSDPKHCRVRSVKSEGTWQILAPRHSAKQ